MFFITLSDRCIQVQERTIVDTDDRPLEIHFARVVSNYEMCQKERRSFAPSFLAVQQQLLDNELRVVLYYHISFHQCSKCMYKNTYWVLLADHLIARSVGDANSMIRSGVSGLVALIDRRD